MHGLHIVKDLLLEELESHAEDKDLNMQSLQEIDTLAHAAKNVCKIIECCENEKSERGYSRDDGMSYGRRRDSMGRYAREYARDDGYAERRSMRGNSYAGGGDAVADQLEQMMETAADERTRGKFKELIREMRRA